MLVIIGLHHSSSFFGCCLCFLVDLNHGFGEFNCCWVREGHQSGGVGKNLGISSIEDHEQGFASRTVNPVVVHKLSKQEPITPVGLLMVNEDAEVLLHFLVDSFCLSVSLGVEGHGGIGSDVEKSVQFFHKLGDKLGPSVRDNDLRHTVSCIDMVVENSCPSFS